MATFDFCRLMALRQHDPGVIVLMMENYVFPLAVKPEAVWLASAVLCRVSPVRNF